MPRVSVEQAEARRNYRQQLRNVARLLRGAGILLASLGIAGLALSHPGAWFVPPSWISLVMGLALLLSGVVRREVTPHPGSDV